MCNNADDFGTAILNVEDQPGGVSGLTTSTWHYIPGSPIARHSYIRGDAETRLARGGARPVEEWDAGESVEASSDARSEQLQR